MQRNIQSLAQINAIRIFVALSLSGNMHKKVYMLAMQLLFVLFEKLGESFFDAGHPSIGGTHKLEGNPLEKNHNNNHFSIKLWEN